MRRSPERILAKPYSYSPDIWSLGVIVYEMATGTLPFPPCKKLIDSLQHIGYSNDITVPPDFGLSKELTDFIQQW